MNKAIVLGVGPVDGLGGQLAVRFGSSGHHVFVAGRTQASLDELSSVIEGSGGRATAPERLSRPERWLKDSQQKSD